MSADSDTVMTERLDLRRPHADDLDELFQISSDPRVWTHYPSLRATEPAQTSAMLERFIAGWHEAGLDFWTVRERGREAVIGYGGCSARPSFWNLGYRLTPGVQGRGYATELSAEAMRRAAVVDPDQPIVAYMVEHNVASARVAEKVGLTRACRVLDAGNPDPAVIRLIYADRTLTATQLGAFLR